MSLPTREPEKAFWPLRGTQAPNRDATRVRPIVVRVGNDLEARPVSGLTNADMVWEMLVEGGITRYALVYHSEAANQIGPVRSARLSDIHYMPMFRGILANVGAQGTVLQRIRDAAKSGRFVLVDQIEHAAAYDRIASRRAPQNVYTSTTRLREASGDNGAVDVPAFPFDGLVKGTVSTTSAPATTVTLNYVAPQRAVYTYDAAAGGYKRVQAGQPTRDGAGGRDVVATNVVVIKTDITEVPGIVEDQFGSLSLEVRSTGTGPVLVFREGQRFEGTWTRQGDEAYKFTDASGAPIALKPGQTWVHVVQTDFGVESAQ